MVCKLHWLRGQATAAWFDLESPSFPTAGLQRVRVNPSDELSAWKESGRLGDGIVQVHFAGREGIAGKDKSRLGDSVGAAW